MEIRRTSDITNQKLKVLVYGPSGSGKTRLCATAKKPIILSVESGLLSLKDFDIPYIEIKNADDLREAYKKLYNNKEFDWICIDSASEVAEVVLADEKKKSKDGRKAYGEMQDTMMSLLRSFRDLDKNVYFSAKQDRLVDSLNGTFVYGPSAPGSKIGPAMPYLFDEVFVLHTIKDDEANIQSMLQTSRCDQYEAKDRSGKLDFNEPADLTAIYNKIFNKKGE